MLENLITAGYMHPWEDDGYDEIRKLSATALSMNFPGNFFHIGDIATAGLKELVHDLTEEQWRSFALRQKRYEVHTIPFLHLDPEIGIASPASPHRVDWCPFEAERVME